MATATRTRRVVADALRQAAADWPDKTAVQFEDRGYSYAELWSRARRSAAALKTSGVTRGDAVLVMLDNAVEFVDAWLGLALLGAIQVPVNTEYRGEIMRHQIKNSGAKLMLLGAEFVERVDALRPDVGSLQKQLVVGGTWDGVFGTSGEIDETDIVPAEEHDIVAIMYTSGTTGPSKGVRVAHAHAYTYAQHAGEVQALKGGDVYYAPLPLFHIAGQWALVYAAIQVGATAVVRRRFSATEYWRTVREAGVTVSFLLGAMANFLARQHPLPNDRDNPLDRMLLVPLVDELQEFKDRFGVRVATCYGSTEVNVPLATGFDVTDPTMAGRPLAGFDLRIVDEHDREVPTGTVGELCVRAHEPWVTATEYHGNPAATVHAFRNLWLHSGDAFRKDSKGNYHFVDRIKDYIRRRGENISSFEVEREVNAHPAVLESAAVAVRSVHTEDDLKVVVVPKAGLELDPDELREYLRARVPRFMVPDLIEVVAELPKTPTGKIQKHMLRER
jgi:crotonobetaine/carnitine-CoA ligase